MTVTPRWGTFFYLFITAMPILYLIGIYCWNLKLNRIDYSLESHTRLGTLSHQTNRSEMPHGKISKHMEIKKKFSIFQCLKRSMGRKEDQFGG